MISIRLAQNEQAGICRDSSTRFNFVQSSGVGENPTSSDQGGSKNLPDAPCAATCLDAQEGYSIPPDLQRTDSNRFLISRYDFSLSAASASGCEHFTPCVQASCVFTSGSDNVTPCRHCPHQGVNSSLPVANRGGTVPLLLSGIIDTQCVYCRIERPFARTKGFIEPLSSHPTLGPRHRRREAVSS